MVTISTIMSTTSSCHRNSEACELNIHPSWAKWVPPSPKGQLGTPWSTLCMRSARSAAKRTTWHSLPHAPACNFARKDEQLVRPGHEELRIPRCRAAAKATPCVNSRVSIRLDAKPCLFSVMWLLWSPKYSLRFRGFGARSAKVVRKKCTGPWRELSLHFKMLKTCMFGALLEDGVGKIKCAPDCKPDPT